MDQLKPYLAAMNRNRFWILSAIAVLAAIIVWYSASDAVAKKYETDKRTNDNAFNSLTRFNTTEINKLPNEQFKIKVDELRGTLEGEVFEAWKLLYTNQKAVLPVNKRIPELEKYLVDENFIDQEIPPNIRNIYRDNFVVEDDFRELFAELNLRRREGQNPVDEPGKVDVNKPPVGLVVWAGSPQPYNLMMRYKTNLAPSSLRIRMTQEDLWVFRSLFAVIKGINSKPIDSWLQILSGGTPSEAPVDQANVPIKQINFCDLAQYAMSATDGRPGAVRMLNAETGQQVVARPGAAGALPQANFSVGTQGNDTEDQKLLDGRYIDGRNQPVADPINGPPFSEFKQMFVMMEFVMDQRLIPVLISECANAPILIETRQVLVDLTEVDVPRAVDSSEAARTVNRIEQSPHDAKVQIRGVVFGYSPAKKEKLGTGSDPEPSKRDYGVPIKQREI